MCVWYKGNELYWLFFEWPLDELKRKYICWFVDEFDLGKRKENVHLNKSNQYVIGQVRISILISDKQNHSLVT